MAAKTFSGCADALKPPLLVMGLGLIWRVSPDGCRGGSTNCAWTGVQRFFEAKKKPPPGAASDVPDGSVLRNRFTDGAVAQVGHGLASIILLGKLGHGQPIAGVAFYSG